MVNSKVGAEAVQTVARENSFHPVLDYLRSLEWDGVPRISEWLTIYLGAEATEFTKAIGRRWLISAIARVERPGCQVDHTLLLEGPQGIKKSTALRTLATDDWFVDHVSDLGTKDSRLDLCGKWIVELSEMDRVRGAQLERVKAFLTQRIDHFRPPYGRRSEDVRRQCVFAASVNNETPLTDETGNRRWWPVRCGAIDIDALIHDRDQLWAEAYKRYHAGDVWWLDSAELNQAALQEQDERYDPGVWDDLILDWADDPKQRYERDGQTQLPIEPFNSTRDRVTVTDILVHAIRKPPDRCTQADRNQVVRCLVHHGWRVKQDRTRGPLRGKRFYHRPQREQGEHDGN
jgi:predicted P-loop ATPase